MEFGPILRAMTRNKTGAILIALQIAFTMTIMINAIHIIEERNDAMARPSGLDEANLFYLSSTGFADDFNEQQQIEEDLRQIRALSGVVNAVQINAIPLSGGGWSMGLSTEPGADANATGVAVYFVDEHGIDTFGVEQVAGENFSVTDVGWRERTDTEWPDKTIMTVAMATELFPDDPMGAVGKTVYINDTEPMTVIGLVKTLQAPWNGWSGVERSMLVPQKMLFGSARYLIRTEPGARDTLMPQVEEMLAASNRGRIIRSMQSLEETRERSYRGDRSMTLMLKIVVGILTAVTALGIVGLASFAVNRRTRQIGTRRALGASKGDIMRYFLVENFMITTMGVVLGAIMTVVFNILLVDSLSLPPLNVWYIPAAVLVMWAVGFLAVSGPARRASNVPPAVATRTA